MDCSKKSPDFRRTMGFWKEVAEETNENEDCGSQKEPKKNVPLTASKKKILVERNNDDPDPLLPDASHTHFEMIPSTKPEMGSNPLEATPQITPLCSKICADSSDSMPYDPITNYTSPRPEFLRYNPNRRQEILRRIEDEMGNEEEGSVVDSASSKPSFQDREFQEDEEDGSDAEVDDIEEEEEEEEERPWKSRKVWELILLLGLMLYSFYYLSSPNSSVMPSFQEIGDFREAKVQGTSERNSFSGSLLKAHMGLLDICLNVRDLACGVEGGVDNFLTSEDAFEREDLEEDPPAEVRKVYTEISAPEDEKVGSELVMPNEFVEMADGIGLAAERDEAMLAEDRICSGDELVAEGSEKDEILGAETHPNLLDSFDIGTKLREEAEVEESEELAESFSTITTMFVSKDIKMLLLVMSLLTVITALLIDLLKYFVKSRKNSSHAVLPCSQSVMQKRIDSIDEKRVDPPISAMEELVDKGKQANVSPIATNYLVNRSKEFYATRPPTVELLAEFSLADATASEASTGKKFERRAPEDSQLSQSQRQRQFEEGSQSLRSLRTTFTRRSISPSPSARKVHPYVAAESTPGGSFTPQDKLQRKKDSSSKSEAKSETTTPLRRSNRLRNRMTS